MDPILESERLLFKVIHEEDYDYLAKLYSNEDVCRYLPTGLPYTENQIRSICTRYAQESDPQNGLIVFKVYLKDTDEFIGICGLQPVPEFQLIELFYAYLPEYWRRGYGKEAASKVILYAKEIGLSELLALADIRNIASNEVLKATNFKRNGQVDLWGLTLNVYTMEFERT